MSFDDCATSYIAAHRAGWRNVKHATQWTNTINTYCSPVFGKLPVRLVDVGLVMEVIEPLWTTKPETAGRLRGRIERILDWAKVRGFRDGDNPARWRGRCRAPRASRCARDRSRRQALPRPTKGRGMRPRGGLGAGSEGCARPTVRRPVRPLTRWCEYNGNIARQNGVPLNLGRGARD